MNRIPYGLVGDIGGTNARFALTDLRSPRPEIFAVRSLLCGDFERLEDALSSYMQALEVAHRPRAIVLAIAGPVEAGRAAMTNHSWDISTSRLQDRGFAEALLINDFEAIGHAARDLGPDDLVHIGPTYAADPGQPLAIVGAGTGFGASIVTCSEGRASVCVTEAGHMGFSPVDEVEHELSRIVARRYGRASVERLVSGPGLRTLYSALAELQGAPQKAPSAATITGLGAAREDVLCAETLERFCAIYGAVAGDLALASGARGGVHLAGGIAPQILGFLASSRFRDRFEAKGRLSDFVRRIPSRVIVHPSAALVGAAKRMRRLRRPELVA